VLKEEVQSLLNKRAIEPVPLWDEKNGFYSTFFIVPKKTGGLRPILNLKPLNKYIRTTKFTMETLSSIKQVVQQGDWLASLDLKDAYLHVPIRPSHVHYLRFKFQGRAYQFRCLPFGISTAPRVFTKILVVLVALMRELGIEVFTYLDDLLFKARTRELLSRAISLAILILVNAGFIVNMVKSEPDPTQDLVYIGGRLRTDLGIIQIPSDRVNNILNCLVPFKVGVEIPVRLILRLLGLLASTIEVVKFARLRMRPIQRFLLESWRPSKDRLGKLLMIPFWLMKHLLWWSSEENLLKGCPLRQPATQCTVTTDACMTGWGGFLDSHQGVQGSWDIPDLESHINVLEFKALRLVLKHYRGQVAGKTVLCQSDNTTVVAYVNKQGGTRSWDLCQEAVKLWEFCIQYQITPIAIHLPGVRNQLADLLSRRRVNHNEWTMKPEVCHQIFQTLGTPDLDLFATFQNRKCPVFCSWTWDQRALITDAFRIHWGSVLGYAFPPVKLIPRVLRKIRSDQTTVILIAPRWPRRPWYSDLLSLLVDVPLELPLHEGLLSQGTGSNRMVHPNPELLSLVAWKVGGNPSSRRDFHQRLSTQSSQPIAPTHSLSMMHVGNPGLVGVVEGIPIPIKHLCRPS
jgi:hypothetical protein